MKQKLTVLAASCLLAACSTGVGLSGNGVSVGLGLGGLLGNHVGLGTSVNIPLTFDKKAETAVQNPAETVGSKTLAYFDANGRTADSAVQGGFYRQLISVQNGGYLVQDFYSGGEKRTDAMLLAKSDLNVFRATPANGAYTVYAINGNIMQQQNFRDGKVVTVGR